MPHEAFVAIASTRRPGAELLGTLALMLHLPGNGGEREHLLMAAGAAVFHARHGFGNASAKTNSVVLRGARNTAAAAISTAVADSLQDALLADQKWGAVHAAASGSAAHVWTNRMSVHEREAIVADFAQTGSVEGLQWEIDSGNYAAHEV